MLQRLQATPWSTLFGISFMLTLFAAMARLALPVDLGHVPRTVLTGVVAPLALLKYLSGLAGAGSRRRVARAQGQSWVSQLLAMQPPEIHGIQKHVARLLAGVLAWVRRRSPAESLSGTPIHFLKKSSYSGLALVMCALLVIEIPAGWAIMKASGMPPEKMDMLHRLLVVLTVWAMVLGAGDWYWLRSSRHSLEHGTLKLRLGARFSADIDVADITHVQREDATRQPGQRSRRSVLSITPLEAPNVLLSLRRPGALQEAMLYGCAPAACESIRLYVDDPAGFVQLIINARERLPPTGAAAVLAVA